MNGHYATTIGVDGVQIQTVEHLLAAVRGLGIDNLVIELNGPELPAMDGSSAPFVSLLYRAGRDAQVAVRRQPSGSLDPIRVGDEPRWIQIKPAAEFPISYTLDLDHPAVGVQAASFTPCERVFVKELAPARTYGFLKDLELLRQQGLALGGSLDNAVVVGPGAGPERGPPVPGRVRPPQDPGRGRGPGAGRRPRAGPRRCAERRARAEPPPGAGAGEDGPTWDDASRTALRSPAGRPGRWPRRAPASPPLTGAPGRWPPSNGRARGGGSRHRGYNALLCPGGAGRPGAWRPPWDSWSRQGQPRVPGAVRLSNLVVTNSGSTLVVPGFSWAPSPRGSGKGCGPGFRPPSATSPSSGSTTRGGWTAGWWPSWWSGT